MSHSPWLSLEEALQKAIDAVTVITQSEVVNLELALNRVVSTPILAPVSVPPWDNSAMDGYAVNTSDAHLDEVLPISQTLTAGMAADTALSSGTVARIMTGAQIPAGANAVIMQENTDKLESGDIQIKQAAQAGENIRVKGSDIVEGNVVVDAGTRLTPSHLMLIASLGLAQVEVYRSLRVGLLATGDELAQPGTDATDQQIYEANRTGVRALLTPLAVEIKDYGIAKDNPDDIRDILKRATQEVDVLISSGGVSVGDADFVKDVIDELGDIDFWKVAIKPGKPFAFGKISQTFFCGLPGNPVSAYVTTEQIVAPLLRVLQGETKHSQTHRLTLKAQVTKDYARRAGRKEFLRAVWHTDESGKMWVTPLQKQSSGVMSTVTQANCYLVLDASQARIEAGEDVLIQPFSLSC